jgi:hypothetical protein
MSFGSKGKPNWKRWIKVLKSDPCVYCVLIGKASRGGFSVEHILPASLGGVKYSWKNVASACKDCNNRRFNKPLLIFLIQQHQESTDYGQTSNGDVYADARAA